MTQQFTAVFKPKEAEPYQETIYCNITGQWPHQSESSFRIQHHVPELKPSFVAVTGNQWICQRQTNVFCLFFTASEIDVWTNWSRRQINISKEGSLCIFWELSGFGYQSVSLTLGFGLLWEEKNPHLCLVFVISQNKRHLTQNSLNTWAVIRFQSRNPGPGVGERWLADLHLAFSSVFLAGRHIYMDFHFLLRVMTWPVWIDGGCTGNCCSLIYQHCDKRASSATVKDAAPLANVCSPIMNGLNKNWEESFFL